MGTSAKSRRRSTKPPGRGEHTIWGSVVGGRQLLAVSILVCLLVTGILVVRSLRPVDEKPPRLPARASVPGRTVDAQMSSPVNAVLPATATVRQWMDELRRVADNLVQRFPKDPEALSLAGNIYQAYGDGPAAICCWEMCLQQYPNHLDALAALGHSQWRRGEFEEAIVHLQKAFAAYPQLPDKYLKAMVESLLNLGQWQEAISVVEQSRGVQGLEPETALLLGQACLQAKEYQKARDQFEKVLSIDPQRKEAHYMLAKVFARLGDADLAAKHRREFARLEQETSAAMEEDRVTTRNQDFHEDRPLMATFWLYAGMIHAKYGGLDEAERYCLSAATLNPQDRDIQEFLETLRASQRRRPAYPS